MAYLPGLHGPFLFDDFSNLPALGALGPVDSWPSFFRYITSGHADPTGRPLTLLTFLIDAHNWPADPFPFKRTNLIIHLINGVLLARLLWRLGRQLEPSGPRAPRAAVFGASLWLLHPLFVSTTLYIVQREAMLPATFTLLGLTAWLHARARFNADRTVSGSAWMIAGLGLGTFLAVLSKANGALLPLLCLVLEYTFVRRCSPITAVRPRRIYQRWLILLGWLPAILLVAFIAHTGIQAAIHGLGMRPWTEGQRLLTEPRVVLTYLGLLWLPRPFSTGLFNDAFPVSHSLWHPWTTLPALTAVLALVVIGWRMRRRAPVVAAAILFFFAGHLLESSAIPLELYFEHRNYLPAMLMFWPLAWWLADLRTLKTIKIALIVTLPLTLAALTWTRAGIWGDATEQALIWARINPDSPRAQAYASQFELAHDHPGAAIRRLVPLLRQQPEQLQLALNLLSARCASTGVGPSDVAAATRAMRLTPNPASLIASWFGSAVSVVQHDGCQGLDLDALDKMLDAGLANPKLRSVRGRMQDIYYLKGRIALIRNQPSKAEQLFAKGLAFSIRASFAARAAATLGMSGAPTAGLMLLDQYRELAPHAPRPEIGMPLLHAWVLRKQNYWPHELNRLRATLAEDAKHQDQTRTR